MLRVSLFDLTIYPQRTAVVSLPAPALLEIDCTVYRTLKVERESLFFFGLFDDLSTPALASPPLPPSRAAAQAMGRGSIIGGADAIPRSETSRAAAPPIDAIR